MAINLPFIISGFVYNTDGTVLANALVTARNESSNATTTATTDSTGFYAIDCANLTLDSEVIGYELNDYVTVYVMYANGEDTETVQITETQTASGGVTKNLTLVTVTDSSTINYCTVQDVWDELDGVTSSDISARRVIKAVQRAENEIERVTNRQFYESSAVTEYIDINEYTIWRSPEQLYLRAGGQRHDRVNNLWWSDRIKLEKAPVVTLTSVSKNDNSITEADDWTALTESDGTNTSADFRLDYDTGLIDFVGDWPRFGKRSVKVVYTHGSSSVPKVVEALTIKLAVRDILFAKMSNSTFTSVDSISIEGISITKGQGAAVTYMGSLNAEIERLWLAVGRLRVTVI